MSTQTSSRSFLRGLLAGALVVGAAAPLAAHAAAGFTVTRAQESSVSRGMSASDVRQVLGRPEQIIQYGNQAGPTWTYEVRDGNDQYVVFDVDFGRDGKVMSASERIEQRGGD